MKYCLKCGRENEASSKFCISCGYNFEEEVEHREEYVQESAEAKEVQQPQENNQTQSVQESNQMQNAQETVLTEENPEKLQEHLSAYTTSSTKIKKDDVAEFGKKIGGFFKKMGKKKLIILASTLVVVVAAAIFLSIAVIPYAPHYIDGNKAMESKDYPKAIAEYEKAENFLSAKEKLNKAHFEYGEKLFSDGEYLLASEEFEISNNKDAKKEIIRCGEELLLDSKYEDAETVFKTVDDSDAELLARYAGAMKTYSANDYLNAKKMFDGIPGVRDSAEMSKKCIFMLAEHRAVGGGYSDALEYYKQLPADYVCEGVTVADRITLLENSSVTKMYTGALDVKTSHTRSSGSTAYWYSNQTLPGTYMGISTSMASDGTFTVSGNVTFPVLPFYKEVEKTTRPTMEKRSFRLEGVTEAPSTIKVDENTTITCSGGEYKLRYSDKDSQGFTRLVNITFSKPE